MKYFEFERKNFEYCALIAARSIEDAIECYMDNVNHHIEYSVAFPQPIEITEEKAFEKIESFDLKYVNSCKKEINLLENHEMFKKRKGSVLLIDEDLI